MPVRQLQRRLTSRDFAELMAYDRCEGLPDWWLMTGIVASAAANAFGGKTKPRDFMPKRRRRLTVEEQWGVLVASAPLKG